MKNTRLIQNLTAYGADMQGIDDRFMGDEEFYEECFMKFMKHKDFCALTQAMRAGDYGAAFTASHGLKGLSANLGLTPFYKRICELVEALRNNTPDLPDSLYAAVLDAYDDLRVLI